MAGIAADLLGDPENALSYLAEASRIGQESGQTFNSASAAASMARIYAELGIEDDETAALRTDATTFMEGPLGEMLATTVLLELARIERIRGDLPAAADMLTVALAGSSAVKNLELPGVKFELAAVRIAQGDLDAARDLATEGAEFAAGPCHGGLPTARCSRPVVLYSWPSHVMRKPQPPWNREPRTPPRWGWSGWNGGSWALLTVALAAAGRTDDATASLDRALT